MSNSTENEVAKKRIYLKKDGHSIFMVVENDPGLRFPWKLEMILKVLTKYKLPYEPSQVEFCFEKASGEEVEIARYIDSLYTKPLLKTVISTDAVKAFLIVIPFLGGTPLDSSDLEKLVAEERLEVNVQRQRFPEIVRHQTEYQEVLLAEGIPHRPGKDAQLIFHFNTGGVDIKPQELDDGRIDFYNLNLIQVVEPGTLLVEKIPPTLGVNGKNVFGQETKALPGKDVLLPVGQYVQVNENSILAGRSGHVVFVNNKVSVLPNYEVKNDVDFNTGNIKFPGNVIIRGNVKNNFEVEASGDVEVFGNIEGTVRTEANIQVKKGIVRGTAFAKGNIVARYIENGHAESDKEIIVAEAVMHSITKAGKKVTVGGKKGLLVGGSCAAGEEIRAKNIGSAMGTTTTLEVGIQPALRQEFKEITRRLATTRENLDKIEILLRTLNDIKQRHGSLPPDKNVLQMKYIQLQQQLRQELEGLKTRKVELDLVFDDMYKARIVVDHSIFSGVNIYMGKSVHTVMEEQYRVIYTLEDGIDIKCTPLREWEGKL